MWFNIEFRWILAIFLMLNGLAAIWIYYDSQRFSPRIWPTGWALSCLIFSCLTLFVWWFKTGSNRSGLVFFLLLTVAIIVTGFNREPIDQLINLQVSTTMDMASDTIQKYKEL